MMSVRRMYFKKLISIAIMSLVFWGIYFVSSFLLGSFINFIKNNLIKALIFMVVPAAFVIFMSYRRRLENAELRRAYLKEIEGNIPDFKSRIAYVLKSADFRAEALAFATVLLIILSIAFITGGAKGYFWTNMLSLAISFVMYGGVYVVANMICWLAVHKKWIAEKL